jgi:bifunctional non-homologous end joining protein LigD
MSLKEYRHKRDFRKTSEPGGARVRREPGKRSFVIQKHDASHLHYDFRLELNGVLKSWAVPKGPDLDPANKRLAMQVEDHPLEYGAFEGMIPEGEYGGGTVMLWDKGEWEPIGDPVKGLREGHLKFTLSGHKLHGAWMLVRKGGRSAEDGERHWFLFKERDEFARPGESITDEMPLSITTGRNLDEIAAASDRVWGRAGEVVQKGGRKRKAPEAAANHPGKSRQRGPGHVQEATGSAKAGVAAEDERRGKASAGGATIQTLLKHPDIRRAPLPATAKVELATLVDAAPQGEDWLHEIKFDGYRMLCRVEGGKVRFISRNGLDWTGKLPELAQATAELPVKNAMLDGEVVSLKADGTSSFQTLQNGFERGATGDLVYYAFDILHIDGRDVTRVPLEERKEILRSVISKSHHDTIRYSDYLQGAGQEIIKEACHLQLEGIIAKRRGSIYRPGRGLDWLKVKCLKREEFVVGGFTKPSGGRSHFGALLLGYYDHGNTFTYAGRVGTGFNDETLASLHKTLSKLVQTTSPFANRSSGDGQAKDVQWVKPSLVVEVKFANWTDQRLLRHSSFQGLREDKPARDVIHEKPISLDDAKAVETDKKPERPLRNGKSKSSRRPRASSQAAAHASDKGEWAGVRLSHPDKILYPD